MVVFLRGGVAPPSIADLDVMRNGLVASEGWGKLSLNLCIDNNTLGGDVFSSPSCRYFADAKAHRFDLKQSLRHSNIPGLLVNGIQMDLWPAPLEKAMMRG